MAAAQMPRNPLYTPPARPQTQHLRYVVRRLHHLPPWIVPRWGFRDSLLVHALSPQLAKEGAIPRGAGGAIFHGAGQDRKRRFDDRTEVRCKIAEALKKTVGNVAFFDGVHIFTPHADVPDDSALRLVVLPPEIWYAREETRLGIEAVLEIIAKNGAKPRYRGNRLIVLAPDHGALSRLSDAARVALAWGSIVDDVKEGRLNI